MFCKTITTIGLILGLSACSIIYHQPVQQGNIITPEEMRQVHRGMSEQALVALLGSPVLKSTFSNDKKVYVYYFSNKRAKVTSYWLRVYMKHGRVARYEKDYNKPDIQSY